MLGRARSVRNYSTNRAKPVSASNGSTDQPDATASLLKRLADLESGLFEGLGRYASASARKRALVAIGMRR
jgi:hypothetical protein